MEQKRQRAEGNKSSAHLHKEPPAQTLPVLAHSPDEEGQGCAVGPHRGSACAEGTSREGTALSSGRGQM